MAEPGVRSRHKSGSEAMSESHIATATQTGYRSPTPVGLATTLLLLTLAFVTPARAEHQLTHDPAARLRIVLKSIHVNDDHDLLSSGDIDMQLMVNRCLRPTFDDLCTPQTIYNKTRRFSADTGQTVVLNLPIPHADNSSYQPQIQTVVPGFGSEATGLSVYSSESYSIMVRPLERDTNNDFEYMGAVFFNLEEAHGWGSGTQTLRSRGFDGQPDGDFVVLLEISRTPLPNLVAHSIVVVDAVGGTNKRVCPRVLNAGLEDAGPFNITVRIDGGTPPGGKQRIPGLQSGESTIPCVETDRLPEDRAHFLSLSLDEDREVPEMDDSRQRTFLNVPATAAPENGTEPPPGESQADLVVATIRINGKAITTLEACHEGKNDIVATIKNQGGGPAGGFVTRLEVDDGDTVDQSLPTLNAGAERDVPFEDVRLKKGERELTVTADAKKSVAESNEENNERKATVKCKDDD